MAEPSTAPEDARAKRPLFSPARLAPLVVLAAGLGAFFYFDLGQFLSLDALRDNREALTTFVADNRWIAAALFIAIYTLVVAFSLPGGAIMTITGGFLFGTLWGTLWVLIGATAGATAVFLIARTALGDALRARAGGLIKRMEEGFQEGAFSYLLFLRLIPVFPFWAVNLAPAFLGVPTRTYVIATFIGIIPGSLVYASVGNGLGAIFEAGGEPDLGIIFRPEILLPIVGLGVLALIPVLYKRFKGGRGANSEG